MENLPFSMFFTTYRAIQPSLHLNTNYKNQQEATAMTIHVKYFISYDLQMTYKTDTLSSQS